MKKFLLASVVVFALMALACAQDNNNGNTITVTKTEPVVQTVQSINVAKETTNTFTQVATNQFPQVSGGTLLLESTSPAAALSSFWLALW
jgi:opacity protein-like surface antigen